jgi:hypothetical protein
MRFVVRYTSIGPHSKNMSAHEVDRLRDAGLAVVTVFENGKGHMLQGRAAGVDAAKASRHLDIDPRGFKFREWDRVRAYLDGAASVLGRRAVGVYGAYAAIEELVPGSAMWGWQTVAWSDGQWSRKAHLQQYAINKVDHPCGGPIDLDRANPHRDTTDYGQWGQGDVTDPIREVSAWPISMSSCAGLS